MEGPFSPPAAAAAYPAFHVTAITHRNASTHLRERGVEHTVVGRPMNTWRNHMPLGLFLKSEPYGSAIATPARGHDIATYSQLHGFDDYVDRVGPLSLDRFLGTPIGSLNS